uniref:Uncharacterized protein n=1 Tax=Candidatus Kentrum sp. FW TaxID=2126338 RepID=A0A450TR79_9GAMM|nr:MAG: hypothetical protein BECKFW1821B_GA0114236_11944 [Candidatus Kentron sp. FW]
MVLFYVFLVLPSPVILHFIFGGEIHWSAIYKFLGFLGVISLPYYIWSDIRYRNWFYPIIVQPDGLMVYSPNRQGTLLWKEFEKMERISHPDWDYYQVISSGVRLTFPSGRILRIFEKLGGYDNLMGGIKNKVRK